MPFPNASEDAFITRMFDLRVQAWMNGNTGTTYVPCGCIWDNTTQAYRANVRHHCSLGHHPTPRMSYLERKFYRGFVSYSDNLKYTANPIGAGCRVVLIWVPRTVYDSRKQEQEVISVYRWAEPHLQSVKKLPVWVRKQLAKLAHLELSVREQHADIALSRLNRNKRKQFPALFDAWFEEAQRRATAELSDLPVVDSSVTGSA